MVKRGPKNPKRRKVKQELSLSEIIEMAIAEKKLRVVHRGDKIIFEVYGEKIGETTREEFRETYLKKVRETGKTLVDLVRECYHAETDPELKAEAADLLAHISEHPEVGGYPVKPDPARPN